MRGTVLVTLFIVASCALLFGARALRERFVARRQDAVDCDNFTLIDSRLVADSLANLKQQLDKRDARKTGL